MTALKWLPIIMPVLMLTVFFVTYGMAVSYGHVSAIWPYISDTGTTSPESCVFSMMMNICAFMSAILVYVRHQEVSTFINQRPSLRMSARCNRAVTAIGYVFCIGLSITGSFQETNVYAAHLTGAGIFFFFVFVYMIAQCVYTYRMKVVSKSIFALRVAITVIYFLIQFGIFAPIGPAYSNFKGKDVLLWEPDDGGYAFHLISTFSEWLAVISVGFFFGTFYFEFDRLEILEPVVKREGRLRDAQHLCCMWTCAVTVVYACALPPFWVRIDLHIKGSVFTFGQFGSGLLILICPYASADPRKVGFSAT